MKHSSFQQAALSNSHVHIVSSAERTTAESCCNTSQLSSAIKGDQIVNNYFASPHILSSQYSTLISKMIF